MVIKIYSYTNTSRCSPEYTVVKRIIAFNRRKNVKQVATKKMSYKRQIIYNFSYNNFNLVFYMDSNND